MRSVGNTYWTVALHGDWQTAATLLKEALQLGGDYEDPMLVNGYVAAMGQVALLRNQPEAAARLFGATDAFLTAADVKFAPADQSQFEQNMEAARAALDPRVFRARFEEGSGWSPSQAIAATIPLQAGHAQSA